MGLAIPYMERILLVGKNLTNRLGSGSVSNLHVNRIRSERTFRETNPLVVVTATHTAMHNAYRKCVCPSLGTALAVATSRRRTRGVVRTRIRCFH